MSSKKKTPTPIPKSISDATRNAGPKPADAEPRTAKKNYAERLSNEVARYLAARLRELGLKGCQPDEIGGRERQFAGGIGAKKVDVSFATEEDGLVLAVSVKSISFKDKKSQNFQKNLTNRRGDLLSEATTLHQRFPYAVVGGLFMFDRGAAVDSTSNRVSTFVTAHEYFRAFNNRSTQANAVQKFEALGIALYQSEHPFEVLFHNCGKPESSESIETFFSRLLEMVAERNPDRFRFSNGKLTNRSDKKPLTDQATTGDDEYE
jgi:hypothetical protein